MNELTAIKPNEIRVHRHIGHIARA